ncbi:MAG: deoxyribodipyrimidine photo-lyase [Planctomycetaceae bacterium]
MPHDTALVWFRRDFRLADNPALRSAIDAAEHVIPIYIHAPDEEGDWAPGGASRWWLHHTLAAHDAALRERQSRLIIRAGPSLDTLQHVIQQTGATAVFWNRRYEPAIRRRDELIKSTLSGTGIEAVSRPGNLLSEPWEVTTGGGGPYQVFTPFWKNCCLREPPAETLPKPRAVNGPASWPQSIELAELRLLPKLDWDAGFYTRWTPGEAGAQVLLKRLMQEVIARYDESRNRPDQRGTSSLSPHLYFGEITPRQIYEAVTSEYGPPAPTSKGPKSGPMTFLSEIGWREFAWHVLYHFPDTPLRPLREKFAAFPWRTDNQALSAWQRGQTGYPIVDAGMRELWHDGWMHNRVRMIVGSFLTKHLRISWLEGAKWFWDTLVDADLANNTLGWQWIGGCGADAAPYFRVFNPVSQGEKFDPQGDYVRKWVPELSELPDEWLHQPWQAPDHILKRAGVVLGQTYPKPIVDHAEARKSALAAFDAIK